MEEFFLKVCMRRFYKNFNGFERNNFTYTDLVFEFNAIRYLFRYLRGRPSRGNGPTSFKSKRGPWSDDVMWTTGVDFDPAGRQGNLCQENIGNCAFVSSVRLID